MRKTDDYLNEDNVWFGTNMKGVANPMVTTFTAWPVCRYFIARWSAFCCMLHRQPSSLSYNYSLHVLNLLMKANADARSADSN